jgi:glycosyltransferase involved in cell wall biosynthesis
VKVLLMAYECSPHGTSERAVGWGRLLEAARVAEVHLVTSEGNFQAMAKAQADGLLPVRVTLHTPEPDAKLRELEKKGVLFAYNYTAYHHWQKLAMRLARELHGVERFDLVHQVNVCTFREPGYTWQLGIPYIWGPMGGSQNFPARFLTMLSAQEALKEGARGVSNWLSLRLKRRVGAAGKAAAVVFGANSTNQRDFEGVFRRKVELLLETGVHAVGEPDRTRFLERVADQRACKEPAPLRLLWIGELQTRKALPILLRALARLGGEIPFELKVLGAGPMRERWEREAAHLGLSKVEFLGKRPFAEVLAEMEQAHLFCFTSLRDTSGNVVLEALAAGVPVACFDHQGARDMVSAESGVKLPVRSPGRAVEDWARTLRELFFDAERLLRLSQGTTAQARKFLWSRNGDCMNALRVSTGLWQDPPIALRPR